MKTITFRELCNLVSKVDYLWNESYPIVFETENGDEYKVGIGNLDVENTTDDIENIFAGMKDELQYLAKWHKDEYIFQDVQDPDDMEYTDLKNGDIVVMTHDEYFESRIIIVDRVEQSYTGLYKLYTYAELDIEYDVLFLEKYEPGFAYDVKYFSFRPAEEEEKIKLYHALGKEFTEEYDKDWYEHFTDSSYYDITDFLVDAFCIKMNDDYGYPDFLDDIQRYIWRKCCEAVGMPDENNEEPKEILISIDKAIKYLEANFPTIDNVGKSYKDAFIQSFKNAMTK